MDMEKAHDAVVKVIGEAVIQMLSEGRALTNARIADMVTLLSEDEEDLAVVLALDMLRK